MVKYWSCLEQFCATSSFFPDFSVLFAHKPRALTAVSRKWLKLRSRNSLRGYVFSLRIQRANPRQNRPGGSDSKRLSPPPIPRRFPNFTQTQAHPTSFFSNTSCVGGGTSETARNITMQFYMVIRIYMAHPTSPTPPKSSKRFES